jgi:hypothetical protein
MDPMLAYTTSDGERKMERFIIGGDFADSVAYGREKLASNPMDANDAVLLYDGWITLGNEKLDAVIIEMRTYRAPEAEAVMAVPYRPKGSGRFLVHKPKLRGWKNCDDFDMDAALQSFWDGVQRHEKGAKIWDDCLDESK